MNLDYDAVFYEEEALSYPLGQMLRDKYAHLSWTKIDSHNRIKEFSSAPNKDFIKLKKHLIVGVRKTHRYTWNQKVSDRLVPYTSSGCRAMCLYCYLVCNYNKCSYLRVFVNRENMMDNLLKKDGLATHPQTFEVGSNSDLILENIVTQNLPWTINTFAQNAKGKLTFPTKFDMIEPLLDLNHRGKIIFRMSVNPVEIIRKTEFGTSPLDGRIKALNRMAEAGYPVGLLIAPVILVKDWKTLYGELIEYLADTLSPQVRKSGFIEIILMTYSFIHNEINRVAFPSALPIFNKQLMTGKGRGKYSYNTASRNDAEVFLKAKIKKTLGMSILYIS